MTATATALENTTEASSFEALFTRRLKPQGAFADELRKAGFDPACYRGRLPTKVWHRCIEISRRHTFPQLPPEEGYRRLGLIFMEGYFETIVGKILAVGMPLLGLERSLSRVPRAWKSNQPMLEMSVTKETGDRWRVEIAIEEVNPDFCAGLLEGGALPIKVPVKVEVVERQPHRCVLSLRRL